MSERLQRDRLSRQQVRLREALTWCPTAAQLAPPQYSRYAVHSANTVDASETLQHAKGSAEAEGRRGAGAPTVD